MKGIRYFMLLKFKHLLCSLLTATMLFSLSSNAFAARQEPIHYPAILQETDRAKQTSQFVSFAEQKIKYVASDVYTGKQGKWIAFADIYSEYNNGIFEKHLLSQATVQYNARSLPTDTKSATLVVNDTSVTQPYEKKSVSFVFDSMDVPKPKKTQKTVDMKISVLAGGQNVSIPLKQSYFNDPDHLTSENILETVSFAYCDYAKKNNVAEPAQIVMRLKSYVSDTVLNERSYSWEIYFIEKSTLPSPSILIRYDCETESTLVSEREFKDYFK